LRLAPSKSPRDIAEAIFPEPEACPLTPNPAQRNTHG